MATLPEGVGLDVSPDYIERPTNTFIIDHNTNQVTGMDAGLLAMRQAVEIILRNERFHWQVYTSDFGIELDDLPGEEYDYIISELPRRIDDAFSTDSRILSADQFVFEQKGDALCCSFDVTTVYGTFSEEVILS